MTSSQRSPKGAPPAQAQRPPVQQTRAQTPGAQTQRPLAQAPFTQAHAAQPPPVIEIPPLFPAQAVLDKFPDATRVASSQPAQQAPPAQSPDVIIVASPAQPARAQTLALPQQAPSAAIPHGVHAVEPLAEHAQLSFEERLRAAIAKFTQTDTFTNGLAQVEKKEKTFTDFVHELLIVCSAEASIERFADYKFFYKHLTFFFKELIYPDRELCDKISREREKLLGRENKHVRKQRAQQFLETLQRLTRENRLPADVYAKDEEQLRNLLLSEEETPALQEKIYRAILKSLEAPGKKAVKLAMQMLIETDDMLANFERQRRVEQTTDASVKWIAVQVASLRAGDTNKRSLLSTIARAAHVRARNDVHEFDRLFEWIATYLSMNGLQTTVQEVRDAITLPQQRVTPQPMQDHHTGTFDVPPEFRTTKMRDRPPSGPVNVQPTRPVSKPIEIDVELEPVGAGRVTSVQAIAVETNASPAASLETAFEGLERTALVTGPDTKKLRQIVTAVFRDQERAIRSGGMRGLVEDAMAAIERARISGVTLESLLKQIDSVTNVGIDALNAEFRADLTSYRRRLEKIGQ